VRYLLLALLLISLSSSMRAQRSSSNPTVKQDLEWMQNTLASGGGDLLLYYQPPAVPIGAISEKRSLRLTSFKGCQVQITYTTYHLNEHEQPIKETFHSEQRFNLSDIDSSYIDFGPLPARQEHAT
jgi:hypothetical protein